MPQKGAPMASNGLAHYFTGIREVGTVIAAGIVAIASSYWAGSSEALRVALAGALCVTVSDTILGVVVSFSCPGRKFSSHAFSKVFAKMIVYFFTLLAAFGVDMVADRLLGSGTIFQLTVSVCIMFRELSSVLEHSALLGVPWPEALTKKLDLTRKAMEHCLEVADPEKGEQCDVEPTKPKE